MVVVGIGVVAEDALARECGLECDNGIVVDEFLLTSDSTISAIGDCTALSACGAWAAEPGSNRCRTRSIRGARSPRVSSASQNPTMSSPGSGAIRAT